MRKLIACTILTAISLCGCAEQKLDQQLMNVRQQVVQNEALYSKALLAFADDYQKLSTQKHEFQQYEIDTEYDNWVAEHTKDGVVQCSPAEFETMIATHDRRLSDIEASKKATESIVSNFRQMVNEKNAFILAVYGKEADAQKAKESLQATLDSAVRVLGGLAGAAAVALPMAIP